MTQGKWNMMETKEVDLEEWVAWVVWVEWTLMISSPCSLVEAWAVWVEWEEWGEGKAEEEGMEGRTLSVSGETMI